MYQQIIVEEKKSIVNTPLHDKIKRLIPDCAETTEFNDGHGDNSAHILNLPVY